MSELIEPLERTLNWLLSLRDADGRILCPEHRIEHTGKSACAAILALELSRVTGNDDYFEAAVQQGRRLVARLENEPNSPCWTFRPGRHDPYNCSNSVIDGGACSDALASLVLDAGDRLDPADVKAFGDAALLHARTYLRYAVLDKGIPAQRAWGLTGLAAAAALEPVPLLLEAAHGAFTVLSDVQNADGSFPYHPVAWGAGHPGAADASAFYQSRVTGFQIEALRRLGLEATDAQYAEPLRRGLDFLLGLCGDDGVKCGLVEAKPWYWGAEYEVASSPFDVFALARGWRLFGEERFARAALQVHRAWAQHLDSDGRPRSHRPGPGRGRSYQCSVFWAGHSAWAARVLPDLQTALVLERRAPQESTSVQHSESTNLVRLENRRVIAWVRGTRGPYNALHGSPHGGGLLRVQRRSDSAELLERVRHAPGQEAEWTGSSGLGSLARGWSSGSAELRFSLWLARAHVRGRRPLTALATPAATLARTVLAPARSKVSSAFAREAALEVHADGATVRGHLAFGDGSPVAGSSLERHYRLVDEGLEVTESLLGAGRVRGLAYRVPRGAHVIEQSPERVVFRLG